MVRSINNQLLGWIKILLFVSVGGLFFQPAWSASILDSELLAKAAPDECFNGVGNPYDADASDCTDTGEQPKVNQAYVWGLAKTDTHVWYGTVANTLCLVFGSYLGMTDPSQNESWVCEHSQSQFIPGNSDWRPSKLYRYNTSTGVNEDITPPAWTPEGQLLYQSIGIRSAGTHNGVVFFAGPGLGGVNMFAFDENGTLLGAQTFGDYTNIRKWIVANGELYTAVEDRNSTVEGYVEKFAGRILKWEGNVTDPFNFTEVGYLPGSGAELALHEGRLFVSTWPGAGNPAGLYMSPTLPTTGGLTSPVPWKEIWQASDYDPDFVVARTYGGGAMASFDGHLYWGTMHVPLVSMIAAGQYYGLDLGDTEKLIEAVFATNRAIAIFRASDFDDVEGAGTIELLYGEEELKKYDMNPMSPTYQTFIDAPNNMGQTPLWGSSGFGNMYNNYTWTMNVFKDKLYIGTMDWSYMLFEMYPDLKDPLFRLGILIEYGISIQEPDSGADLWRLEESNGPAEAENTTGIGNYANYGIRTMVSDEQNLYLGMANPMNLMTDPTDEKPEGGWELIKMSEKDGGGSNGGGGSSGGGCSYNPHNTEFDMMILIMLALTLLYPWRRKLIR